MDGEKERREKREQTEQPEQPERGGRKTGGPEVIRNRDIPILADVLCIMQEVNMLENRIEWQREKMTSMSQHLTGMPGGGSLPKGLEEVFAMLSEIEESQKKKVREYVGKLRKAEMILDGIRSESMLAFVKMKYVFQIPDVEIRRELNMSRWGFEQAKERVEMARDMAHVSWREKFVVEKI